MSHPSIAPTPVRPDLDDGEAFEVAVANGYPVSDQVLQGIQEHVGRYTAEYFVATEEARLRLRAMFDPRPGLSARLGDMLECGVGRGGGGVFMRGYLASHAVKEGSVYVADRFRATRDDEDLAVRAALAEPFADTRAIEHTLWKNPPPGPFSSSAPATPAAARWPRRSPSTRSPERASAPARR